MLQQIWVLLVEIMASFIEAIRSAFPEGISRRFYKRLNKMFNTTDKILLKGKLKDKTITQELTESVTIPRRRRIRKRKTNLVLGTGITLLCFLSLCEGQTLSELAASSGVKTTTYVMYRGDKECFGRRITDEARSFHVGCSKHEGKFTMNLNKAVEGCIVTITKNVTSIRESHRICSMLLKYSRDTKVDFSKSCEKLGMENTMLLFYGCVGEIPKALPGMQAVWKEKLATSTSAFKKWLDRVNVKKRIQTIGGWHILSIFLAFGFSKRYKAWFIFIIVVAMVLLQPVESSCLQPVELDVLYGKNHARIMHAISSGVCLSIHSFGAHLEIEHLGVDYESAEYDGRYLMYDPKVTDYGSHDGCPHVGFSGEGCRHYDCPWGGGWTPKILNDDPLEILYCANHCQKRTEGGNSCFSKGGNGFICTCAKITCDKECHQMDVSSAEIRHHLRVTVHPERGKTVSQDVYLSKNHQETFIKTRHGEVKIAGEVFSTDVDLDEYTFVKCGNGTFVVPKQTLSDPETVTFDRSDGKVKNLKVDRFLEWTSPYDGAYGFDTHVYRPELEIEDGRVDTGSITLVVDMKGVLALRNEPTCDSTTKIGVSDVKPFTWKTEIWRRYYARLIVRCASDCVIPISGDCMFPRYLCVQGQTLNFDAIGDCREGKARILIGEREQHIVVDSGKDVHVNSYVSHAMREYGPRTYTHTDWMNFLKDLFSLPSKILGGLFHEFVGGISQFFNILVACVIGILCYMVDRKLFIVYLLVVGGYYYSAYAETCGAGYDTQDGKIKIGCGHMRWGSHLAFSVPYLSRISRAVSKLEKGLYIVDDEESYKILSSVLESTGERYQPVCVMDRLEGVAEPEGVTIAPRNTRYTHPNEKELTLTFMPGGYGMKYDVHDLRHDRCGIDENCQKRDERWHFNGTIMNWFYGLVTPGKCPRSGRPRNLLLNMMPHDYPYHWNKGHVLPSMLGGQYKGYNIWPQHVEANIGDVKVEKNARKLAENGTVIYSKFIVPHCQHNNTVRISETDEESRKVLCYLMTGGENCVLSLHGCDLSNMGTVPSYGIEVRRETTNGSLELEDQRTWRHPNSHMCCSVHVGSSANKVQGFSLALMSAALILYMLFGDPCVIPVSFVLLMANSGSVSYDIGCDAIWMALKSGLCICQPLLCLYPFSRDINRITVFGLLLYIGLAYVQPVGLLPKMVYEVIHVENVAIMTIMCSLSILDVDDIRNLWSSISVENGYRRGTVTKLFVISAIYRLIHSSGMQDIGLGFFFAMLWRIMVPDIKVFGERAGGEGLTPLIFLFSPWIGRIALLCWFVIPICTGSWRGTIKVRNYEIEGREYREELEPLSEVEMYFSGSKPQIHWVFKGHHRSAIKLSVAYAIISSVIPWLYYGSWLPIVINAIHLWYRIDMQPRSNDAFSFGSLGSDSSEDVVGLKDGLLEFYKEGYVIDSHIGFGWCKNGVVHTSWHVTNGGDVEICGKMEPPVDGNCIDDIVTYRGKWQFKKPDTTKPFYFSIVRNREEIIVPVRSLGEFVDPRTKTHHLLINGPVVVKGDSGSPIYQMGPNGNLEPVVMSGRWFDCANGQQDIENTAYLTCDSSVEKDHVMDCLKQRGLYYLVDKHCGWGKTTRLMRPVIERAIECNIRLDILVPNNAVALEAKKWFDSLVNFKTSKTKNINPSVVRIYCHEHYYNLLLDNRSQVEKAKMVIMDESHVQSPATYALSDYLKIKASRGDISFVEMSATPRGMGISLGSNHPIDDVIATEEDCFERCRRNLEGAGGQRIFWVVESTRKAISCALEVPGSEVLYSKKMVEWKRDHDFGRPCVVFCTNVVEMGVNLNCDVLIDSGKSVSFKEEEEGKMTPCITRCSLSSKNQRRGRVGRRKPGVYVCIPGDEPDYDDTECRENADFLLAPLEYNAQNITSWRKLYRMYKDGKCTLWQARKMYDDGFDPRMLYVQDRKNGKDVTYCGKCGGRYRYPDPRMHEKYHSGQRSTGDELWIAAAVLAMLLAIWISFPKRMSDFLKSYSDGMSGSRSLDFDIGDCLCICCVLWFFRKLLVRDVHHTIGKLNGFRSREKWEEFLERVYGPKDVMYWSEDVIKRVQKYQDRYLSFELVFWTSLVFWIYIIYRLGTRDGFNQGQRSTADIINLVNQTSATYGIAPFVWRDFDYSGVTICRNNSIDNATAYVECSQTFLVSGSNYVWHGAVLIAYVFLLIRLWTSDEGDYYGMARAVWYWRSRLPYFTFGFCMWEWSVTTFPAKIAWWFYKKTYDMSHIGALVSSGFILYIYKISLQLVIGSGLMNMVNEINNLRGDDEGRSGRAYFLERLGTEISLSMLSVMYTMIFGTYWLWKDYRNALGSGIEQVKRAKSEHMVDPKSWKLKIAGKDVDIGEHTCVRCGSIVLGFDNDDKVCLGCQGKYAPTWYFQPATSGFNKDGDCCRLLKGLFESCMDQKYFLDDVCAVPVRFYLDANDNYTILMAIFVLFVVQRLLIQWTRDAAKRENGVQSVAMSYAPSTKLAMIGTFFLCLTTLSRMYRLPISPERFAWLTVLSYCASVTLLVNESSQRDEGFRSSGAWGSLINSMWIYISSIDFNGWFEKMSSATSEKVRNYGDETREMTSNLIYSTLKTYWESAGYIRRIRETWYLPDGYELVPVACVAGLLVGLSHGKVSMIGNKWSKENASKKYLSLHKEFVFAIVLCTIKTMECGIAGIVYAAIYFTLCCIIGSQSGNVFGIGYLELTATENNTRLADASVVYLAASWRALMGFGLALSGNWFYAVISCTSCLFKTLHDPYPFLHSYMALSILFCGFVGSPFTASAVCVMAFANHKMDTTTDNARGNGDHGMDNFYGYKRELNRLNKNQFDEFKESMVFTPLEGEKMNVDSHGGGISMNVASRGFFKIMDVVTKANLHIAKSVTDMGCGRGGWMQYCAMKGSEVFGYTVGGPGHEVPAVHRLMLPGCGKIRYEILNVYNEMRKGSGTLLCDIGESDSSFDREGMRTLKVLDAYQEWWEAGNYVTGICKVLNPFHEDVRLRLKGLQEKYAICLIRSDFSRNTNCEMYMVIGSNPNCLEKVITECYTMLRKRMKAKPYAPPVRVSFREKVKSVKEDDPDVYDIEEPPPLPFDHCDPDSEVFNFWENCGSYLKEKVSTAPNYVNHLIRKLVDPIAPDKGWKLTDTTPDGFMKVFRKKIDAKPCEENRYNGLRHRLLHWVFGWYKGKYRVLNDEEVRSAMRRESSAGKDQWKNIGDCLDDPEFYEEVRKEEELHAKGECSRPIWNTTGKVEKKAMTGERKGSRMIAFRDAVERFLEKKYLGFVNYDHLLAEIPGSVSDITPMQYGERIKEIQQECEKKGETGVFEEIDIAGWDTKISAKCITMEMLEMLKISPPEHHEQIRTLYRAQIHPVIDIPVKKISGNMVLYKRLKGHGQIMSGREWTYCGNTGLHIAFMAARILAYVFGNRALETYKKQEDILCTDKSVEAFIEDKEKGLEYEMKKCVLSGDDGARFNSGATFGMEKFIEPYNETGLIRKDLGILSPNPTRNTYEDVSFCSHTYKDVVFHTKNGDVVKCVPVRPVSEIFGKGMLAYTNISHENGPAFSKGIALQWLIMYPWIRDVRLAAYAILSSVNSKLVPMGPSHEGILGERPWLRPEKPVEIINDLYVEGKLDSISDVGFVRIKTEKELGSMLHTPERAAWKKKLNTTIKMVRAEYGQQDCENWAFMKGNVRQPQGFVVE